MRNKILFIDCSTGLAGDMLLAAFLDLGVPQKVIEDPLLAMGLGKYLTLNIEESQSYGFRGLQASIEGVQRDSSSTRYQEIIRIIDNSLWEKSLRSKVSKVFKALAEAEAAVHGKSLETVHFHELGSIEALAEVVCVCAAVEYLNPIEVVCSIPPAGSGMVNTAHGALSVPVPVVMELAKRHQIKLIGGDDYPKCELTTPTGFALMAVLADRFGQIASYGIEAFGIGLGKRTFDRPNFLRICSLQAIQPLSLDCQTHGLKWESLVFQEAWIDDATPEDLAVLIAELRSAGAIDVISQPIQMKKGRQGVCVKAIVKSQQVNEVRLAWFSKGTTIGLQEHFEGRWVLPRRRGTCPTVFGEVGVKQVQRPGGRLTIKPEHDELLRISNETGKSIAEIRNELFFLNENFSPNEDWS